MGVGIQTRQSKRTTIILYIAVGLFILGGIILIIFQWEDIRHVLGRADWRWVPIAIVLSAIAYFLIGLIFLSICRLFGLTLKAWDLIKIGYVANVIDNLVPAVGLPGLSVIVLMLTKRGAGAAEAAAPSLFRSYFNNIIFFALLPMALIYTLATYSLPRAQATALIVTVSIIIIFALAVTAAVFSAGVRRTLMRFIIGTWKFLTRRDIKKPLASFEHTFGQGVDRVKHNPKQVVIVIGIILSYWLMVAVVIWFCFISLGSNLNLGIVLTGFLIGRTSGVITFLPGGIGTQDASMVGFYTLFGVPLAEAILVSVLFRVVFYFIPFIASLGFYRSLLKGQAVEAKRA